jgi:hypothetical protein
VSALMSWLDELDEALIEDALSADAEQRLEALLEQGVTLLAAPSPAEAAPVDSQVVDRVQRRLQVIADEVGRELDAVRCARRELTRARRAHAGYRAAGAP